MLLVAAFLLGSGVGSACEAPRINREATPTEIRAVFKAQRKSVLTLLGYSAAEYEDKAALMARVTEILDKLDPKTTIVNIGATPDGIGAVYPLAKERGFTTSGIVSTQARESSVTLSPCVDLVFFVKDASWGGFIAGTQTLSPTSAAMVAVSNRLVAIGGGEVSRDEFLAAKRAGKKVQFIAADMNHAIARERALKRGQPVPTDFRGAAGVVLGEHAPSSAVGSDRVPAIARGHDVARQRPHGLPDQIPSARRGIVRHQLQFPQRRRFERRDVAVTGLDLVLNPRQLPQQLETHGIGIAGGYGCGAALPPVENRAQPSFVAERVGAVGFDHQRVAALARMLAVGEIRVHGFRDVAKQLADRVRGETRRRLGSLRRGRRWLVRRFRTELSCELGQLQLGDLEIELVELFVPAADLAAVTDSEGVQLRLELGQPCESRVEEGALLADASAEVAQVTIVWRT